MVEEHNFSLTRIRRDHGCLPMTPRLSRSRLSLLAACCSLIRPHVRLLREQCNLLLVTAEKRGRVFRDPKVERRSPAARREKEPKRGRKLRGADVRRRAPHGLAIALPDPIDPMAITTLARTRPTRSHRARSPETCRRSRARSRSGRRCGGRAPSSRSDGEARSRSRPRRRTRW